MKLKLLLMMLVTGLAVNAQTTWTVDKAHTNIRFTTTHMMISEVDGEFTDYDATVENVSEGFVGATVEFTAKVNSINTGNERRDGHLKSDDFFNAEEFPEITFKGKIEKEDRKYYLVGDFTMRDVTKKVKFDVKYNGIMTMGETKKAGFKVSGVVNRFDYGLKWDRLIETGSYVVGQDVTITCNVQLNGK